MYYKKNYIKAGLTVSVKEEKKRFDVLIEAWYDEIAEILSSKFLPALPFKYKTKLKGGKVVFLFKNLIKEELIVLIFLIEAFEATGEVNLILNPKAILMGLNFYIELKKEKNKEDKK